MHARLERVKQHVQNNKQTYLSCGVTAIVAVVGTLLYANGRGDAPLVQAIGPWSRASINPVTINMIERSTPSKAVHLVGSNQYYSSLHEAAKETGHSLTRISKQVNGHIPDVGGDVFEVLEPATS